MFGKVSQRAPAPRYWLGQDRRVRRDCLERGWGRVEAGARTASAPAGTAAEFLFDTEELDGFGRG
jgi:hypothetical protein